MQVPVSPEINALLDDAATLSVRKGSYFVGVEHLFEAVLAQADLLPREFRKTYQDRMNATLREVTRKAWRGTMPTSRPEVFYTPRCAMVTKAAAKHAQHLAQESPRAGHLLLAILYDGYSLPSRVVDSLKFGRKDMVKALSAGLAKGSHSGTKSGTHDTASRPKQARRLSQSTKEGTGAAEGRSTDAQSFSLASVTRDLTQIAKEGKLEPAIGRNREMMEILEILARKGKNNAILVGEAGVGKTRVVEGLARASAKGRTGDLMPYRILELNLAAMMAGTQYRGAFEEKLMGLLEELKASDETVLFIDEIHLMMGAGSTDGGPMDLANLLKPALSRGEIRCIGATTIAEYRKFIERDPAMERRFQMVRIEPLTPSATAKVLERIKPSFEKHHGVYISSKAIQAAIALTERYLPHRHLPDKAIDVLDQACARYRLRKVAAKSDPRTFDAGEATAKVTPHDIRKVISRIASVPIEEITAEDRKRLESLERRLNRRVIGQRDAVGRVVAAVKKARAGLSDPHRPDATMLFLGPTGVGKTQLAKALADVLFGAPKHLIPFDMSEYVERHSVSRLLGAPPGYVGSEEEGRLTAAVRNTPFSILLFDEIEKAHQQIFDIFLPILEEGRLKDSRGKEVSFRNCIIIFTSNVGAEYLSKSGTDPSQQGMLDALRKHFRPEFINRIDEIVPFHPLLFEDIRKILHLSFHELKGRLREKQIHLHVYQGAYEYLTHQGYNVDYGARELRRTVDRLVINPISEMILRGDFQPDDCARVFMKNDELQIRVSHGKSEGDPE